VTVETAADRAGLFSRAEFAEPARYTPPSGGSTLCSAIIDRGQGTVRFGAGDAEATGPERGSRLNRDEVAIVLKGGTLVPGTIVGSLFVPGSETFRIVDEPALDETGRIWTLELVLVS
jgi:hypothetical protein